MGKSNSRAWRCNVINIFRLHYNYRFVSIGDVQKGRQFYDVEGKELPGAPGYKYYGAAKDLPGVRELFAEKDEEAEIHKQKRCCLTENCYLRFLNEIVS